MKFVAMVGFIYENSVNKKLISYIKRKFNDLAEIEILDIRDVPMFNQDEDVDEFPKIKELNDKIIESDGVIIVTPEHNHTIPAILKSVIKWLSYDYHPFIDKPVMILGASFTEQGSSRAQLHLRNILDSPGLDALVMPGSEFLLSNALEKFDENGDINDERTIDYIEHCLIRFVNYSKIIQKLKFESIESNYSRKKREGLYASSDPYADATTGASEY